MQPSKRAQIIHQKTDKTFTKICTKYIDFADVIPMELTVELSKHTKINDHAIKLIDNQQSLYSLIYS